MPFSLGLPLIDDNVKKNNLPLYFGKLEIKLNKYLPEFSNDVLL